MARIGGATSNFRVDSPCVARMSRGENLIPEINPQTGGGHPRRAGQLPAVQAYPAVTASGHTPGRATGSPGKAADIQSLAAAPGMAVRSGMPNT